MCNKLNRLNMEGKFIFRRKKPRLQSNETDLKQIRKRTHCAIRRSKFLIQFKYEKKLLKAEAKNVLESR